MEDGEGVSWRKGIGIDSGGQGEEMVSEIVVEKRRLPYLYHLL